MTATTELARPVAAPAVPATRAELEDFFIKEARLLDEWRLNEWFALCDQDIRYIVPPLDIPDADYHNTLFLISDDRLSLQSRVRQLLGRASWAENPHSRTRRLITNVEILDQDGSEIHVTANFAVWRFQHEQHDVYVGRYVHKLVRGPEGQLLLRERKVVLDHETLRPHGKISFIL